ncbi:MAG: hypothetical protein IJZ59_00370 [Alphaproteobacteria bacterium]|nr:hypothetical protein [Alphaproteobacteria bacterium]
MINFIKYHWFGLIMSLIVGIFMVEFFLILFAPHYDLQKRGFVPCTDAMAEDVANCSGKSFCVMKAVTKNMVCDTKVIGHGISEWVKGKQSRPWSNYYFIPEYPQAVEEPDEELLKYYEENPDLAEQMAELKKNYEELEKLDDEK